jgi:hypothetical protein
MAWWLSARACLSALLMLAQTGGLQAEMLTGPQIRNLFAGNTVAGIYVGGNFFSEFHALDGRALGDNGFTLNVDACWNIEDDKVCYHYGPPKDRRTYCFTLERNGDSLNLRTADTGRLNAVASIETGNPRGHADGGRRWSCDDLMSQRGGTPRLTYLRLANMRLARTGHLARRSDLARIRGPARRSHLASGE